MYQSVCCFDALKQSLEMDKKNNSPAIPSNRVWRHGLAKINWSKQAFRRLTSKDDHLMSRIHRRQAENFLAIKQTCMKCSSLAASILLPLCFESHHLNVHLYHLPSQRQVLKLPRLQGPSSFTWSIPVMAPHIPLKVFLHARLFFNASCRLSTLLLNFAVRMITTP